MGGHRSPYSRQPPPQDRLHARVRGAGRGRRPHGRAFVSGARQNTLGRAARERQFMKKKSPIQAERRWDAAALDELIDELTAEAAGDDERIVAFLQALEKHVALPCDGTVIGEPVSVVKFDYQGNQRRGLTAKCRRVDGCEYEVTASEVALSPNKPGSHYLEAYRKWMGVEPYPPEARARTCESPAAALDLRGPVELVVQSVKQKAARVRLLGSDQSVTLRSGRLWTVVPGEIAVVRPGKQWNYSRN